MIIRKTCFYMIVMAYNTTSMASSPTKACSHWCCLKANTSATRSTTEIREAGFVILTPLFVNDIRALGLLSPYWPVVGVRHLWL